MRELFVLGAGASKAAAGTLLGNELVWAWHRQTALFKPIIDGRPLLDGETIKYRDYRSFLEIAEREWPALAGLPAKWEDRGYEAFNPIIESKTHYLDELLVDLQQQERSDDVALIRSLIFKHIVGITSLRDAPLYEAFAKQILSRSAAEVGVISFNFDTLLGDDPVNDLYFDYTLEFDHNYAHPSENDTKIPLIKPNGSFDWGVCRSCGSLFRYSAAALNPSFYIDLGCLPACSGTVEPMITIPHEQQNRKLDSLWDGARNLIETAGRMTIIGYSFPDYDEEIRRLFRHSLPVGTAVKVIDHAPPDSAHRASEQIRRRYAEVLPQASVSVDTSGFESYVDSF